MACKHCEVYADEKFKFSRLLNISPKTLERAIAAFNQCQHYWTTERKWLFFKIKKCASCGLVAANKK